MLSLMFYSSEILRTLTRQPATSPMIYNPGLALRLTTFSKRSCARTNGMVCRIGTRTRRGLRHRTGELLPILPAPSFVARCFSKASTAKAVPRISSGSPIFWVKVFRV